MHGESVVSFFVCKCDILHQLTCLSSEAARLSCDNCQRMSDFDSCQFICIRMSYITGTLASICARSNGTFDIGLHVVCVRAGGRTLRHNQIFLHP